MQCRHQAIKSAVAESHVANHMHPRSDVIGSLLRPPSLLEARQKLEQGELTPAEFKFIEDRAVRDAVALQQDAGLDVVTDGEMRRYAFFGHLVEALEGFDKFGGWSITFRDRQGHDTSLQRPVVIEKLRWRRQMSVEEFTYLRGRTKKPIKVTLLSAQQAAASEACSRRPDAAPCCGPPRCSNVMELLFGRRARCPKNA